MMSELRSQICKLVESAKLDYCLQEISKTGTLPSSLGLLIRNSAKLELGISGVAVLVDQHIAKNCLIHAQFYSFKDSTKRINNLTSVKLEIQQNTNGLLTMSRISSTIFRMATFVYSSNKVMRLIIITSIFLAVVKLCIFPNIFE